MGEIKIKSENLFDVNGEHTSLVWDGKECLVIENDVIIVNQIRPGYMTGIYYDEVYKPGTYTFAMKQLAAQSDKTAISVVSSAPFAGGVYIDSYKAYAAALVKHDDTHYITIVVTESTEIGFFINGYFSVNDKIYDIQILSGTYTAETIPEYQPYFLNRPAHQFTNGEWIDIPTHHFINNRWQGELTSQSPLKFRADGEMLDWRIEGKTSGNLFDVNGNIARESSDSIEISQDRIIITVTATWSRDYVIFDKIFEPGLYTIKIISSSDTSGASYIIGCLSTAPLTGWTYNDYYAAYVKDFDNTLIIKITDSTRIGFRCSSSQVGQKVTLSNIKLLEGAYTPEITPEHEPYGIGDWDETAQKYKIPITVEGNNLFDGEWKQGTIMSPSSSTRVSNKNVISLKPNTVYTIGLRGSSIIQYALVYRDKDGNVTYDSGWLSTASSVLSPISDGATAEILLKRSDAGSISPVREEVLSLKVIFVEGTYTADTLPLYEVSIYTDHQLMDGDSIDFSTDQTQIPIATGNNTLTVDTAVKPSKVFVKFEG